jgi:hypothetical protein
VRDELPGLDRELEVWRRLRTPAAHRPLARRLVERLLDLDDPVLADVVLKCHREATQADPDVIIHRALPAESAESFGETCLFRRA